MTEHESELQPLDCRVIAFSVTPEPQEAAKNGAQWGCWAGLKRDLPPRSDPSGWWHPFLQVSGPLLKPAGTHEEAEAQDEVPSVVC